MILLLIVTSISAQTFDLGEGRKATLDQAGNYRLTWNQKSQNGGTVSGTFSGKLKDGKRNGIWKGSFKYQLFSNNDSQFKSGAINFTRTYTDGVPNGAYSYSSSLKVCFGSYNYISKQWKYSPSESFNEQITGSFINGHADGNWSAYQQQPYEKITMQFDNGKAVGTWTVAEKTSQTLGFKNGYLVQQKEMRSGGWGTELFYSPYEKIEELPNQKTVKISDFLAYGDYYMKGAGFDKFWLLYPENSSNEDYTAYYKLADYDNHLKLIGNVPSYEKELFEVSKRQAKNKESDKKYIEIIEKELYPLESKIKSDWKYRISNELSYYTYFSDLYNKYPELAEYKFAEYTSYNSDYMFKIFKELYKKGKQLEDAFNSKCAYMLDQLSKYRLTDNQKWDYISKHAKLEGVFIDGKSDGYKQTWLVNTKELDDKYLKIIEPIPNITVTKKELIVYLLNNDILQSYSVPDNPFKSVWKLDKKRSEDVTIELIRSSIEVAMKEYYSKKNTYDGFQWDEAYSNDIDAFDKVSGLKKLILRLGL